MRINVLRWLATAGSAGVLALVLTDGAAAQVAPAPKAAPRAPTTPAAPAAPATPRDAIKGVRETPAEARREARDAANDARREARTLVHELAGQGRVVPLAARNSSAPAARRFDVFAGRH